MKNEKMKRVAALALAGTIAVSTVSPAAFADDAGVSGTEPATPSTSQEDSSTNPSNDTTGSTPDNGGSGTSTSTSTGNGSGTSTGNGSGTGNDNGSGTGNDNGNDNGGTGSTPDDDTGNTDTIPVSEPATVEEAAPATPGDGFEQNENTTPVVVAPDSEGELTVKPDNNEDGEPEVVVGDGDNEIPVDNEGVLGVTQTPNEEDSTKTDITIEDYPSAEADGEKKPGTITSTEEVDFGTTPADDEKPTAADEQEAGALEGELNKEPTDGESSMIEEIEQAAQDATGGNNTVTIGNKTYTVGKVEQSGDTGTAAPATGGGSSTSTEEFFTLTTTSEGENAPLTPDEIAKILSAGLGVEISVQDGKIVDAKGNTYEVGENKGDANQTTTTAWTIKVTTTNTTQTVNTTVTDKVDVVDGSVQPDTSGTSSGDSSEPSTTLAAGTSTDQSDLSALNDLKGESASVEAALEALLNGDFSNNTFNGFAVSEKDGTYTLTKENVTYTITTAHTTDTIDLEALLADTSVTNTELAALLNGNSGTSYTVEVVDGGRKVCYTDDKGVKHDLTDQSVIDQIMGQKMEISITRTDAHGASVIQGTFTSEDGTGTVIITGEDAIKAQDTTLQADEKANAEKAAAEDAVRKLLGLGANAPIKEGILTPVYDDSGALIPGKWTFTKDATSTDPEKTYTIHVNSTASSDFETVKGSVTPDTTQNVTVTGNAWVTSGEITWTGKYTGYGDTTTDETEYSELSSLFGTNGKPKFDGEGGEVVSSTNGYDGKTFNGETVSNVNVAGGNYTITTTTTSADGKTVTKTYTFTYEAVDANGTVSDSGDNANGTGNVTVSNDTTQGGGLTKLTWTVSTVEDLASTWIDKQLSTGASITKVEGDNNEYLYKENATDTGTTLYYNESDGKYYTNYTNGNFTGTAYSKELDTQNPLTVDEVKAMLTEKGVTIPEDATINLDTTNHTVTYTDTDGKTVTMSYQDEQKYTIVKEEEVSISATGTDDQSDATKETAIQSVVSQLESVYGSGTENGVTIKEFEEYKAKYKEEHGEEPVLNADTYRAFADYILKEQVTGTQLEGDALVEYLKQNISINNWAGNPINNKTTNTHIGNHFDLGVNSTLILENGNTASCVLLNDSEHQLTAKAGTLDNLVNNFDSEENYQFGLQNYIQKQENQNHFEYTRTEDNKDHTFTDANDESVGKDGSNSYYRITGTIAYVSEENKNNELFTATYDGRQAAEQAKQQAIEQGCDPNQLNVVVYNVAHTGFMGGTYYTTSYKLYDSTAELDTYGYLTDDTNGCIGSNKDLWGRPTPEVDGYDLIMDELVMNNGKVVAGYEGQTSWSATLHKITPESGSSLTVNSLLKTDQATTGNRTSGTYIATQDLKVTKDDTTGGAATLLLDGANDDATADQSTARFQGSSNDSYTLSKEWKPTFSEWDAQANHYGYKTAQAGSSDTTVTLSHSYVETAVKAEAVSKTETTTRNVYAELTKAPAPTQPGTGGGDEDTELPPEEDPSDDLVLILTDVPTEEEIADEATALAAGPETEETVIEEEDTPLAAAPETEEAEIGDDEVAKSAVPKTGDESGVFGLMAVLSGMALGALSFIDRKGRHARFGSQH